MRAIVRSLISVVVIAVATNGFAEDPNLQRGFSAGKMYDLLGLDSVSVYNGNLNVRIPLGQAYTVGPSLQYQFMLAYNSKVWDFQFALGFNDPPETNIYRRLEVPERRSNAGLGWSLTLGELLPPRAMSPTTPEQGWVYLAADGSEHEFRHTTEATTLAYSTDSSYLRLRRETAIPNTTWSVDFPDGTTRHFDADGKLQDITDRYGNWVKIDRTNPLQWIVTDGHGSSAARTHVIELAGNFVNAYSQPYDPVNFRTRPTAVKLAAFGGGQPATYSLEYDDAVIDAGTCGDTIGGGVDKEFYAVPLLKKVTLADGTTYEPTYQTDEIQPCSSGTLAKLVLPTRGAIAWTHGQYVLSNASCMNPAVLGGSNNPWRTVHAGVVERSLLDALGNPLERRTYSPELVQRPPTSQPCGGPQYSGIEAPPEEYRNTVTVYEYDGGLPRAVEKTTSYFSAFPSEASGIYTNFANPAEQGLPLFRGVAHGDRYLSTRAYRCDAGTCTNEVVRTSYVKYAPVTSFPPVNARVEAQRTVSDDDGQTYTDTASSNFDDYGHYRSSTTTSNIPGSVDKTTFMNYLPNSSAWLLNRYDRSWVKQGSGASASVTRTLATFNATTGALESLRTLNLNNPDTSVFTQSGSDLLTVWCRDSAQTAGARGFVTSERYLGNDATNLPTPSAVCGAPRTEGMYVVNHSYMFASNGALTGHQTQYAGASHFIADEVFEPNTGFLSLTRDSAGVATQFEYDKSARLTAVRPDARVATTYEYATTAVPPKVTVAQACPSGVGASPCTGDSLVSSVYYYDSLGRLTEQRQLFNEADWAATWTVWGALGRKKNVTVPVSQTSSDSGPKPSGTPVTSWTYDHLGRVLSETRPDGTSSSVTYTGMRQVERFTAGQRRSTEIFDGAGQLIEVRQPTAPGQGDVITSYAYDVGGRLASVQMLAPTGAVQHRTFDYDPRGLLRWESQPESGMTSYTYDARGHVVTTVQSAANSIFDLAYTYDAAERPLTVTARNPFFGEPNQPAFRVMKEFAYGTDNDYPPAGLADLRRGKLVTASRYNYDTVSSGKVYRIQDAYAYKDSAGRRSLRTTTIAEMVPDYGPVVLKTINTGVTYNATDQPAIIQYPTCMDCGGPTGLPDRSSMLYTYVRGRLETITGVVAKMEYSANGMRRILDHTNARRDLQEPDVLARPASISFVRVPPETGSLERCLRPSFGVQPASTTVPTGGGYATLSVVVSGTGAFEYEWVRVSDSTVVGNAASVTVHVTTDDEFFVFVKNPCGYEYSQHAKVTVGSCTLPTTGGIVTVRQPDGRWLLRPNPSAQQQPSFVWRRLSDGTNIATTETVIVPNPSTAISYRLTITDSCGSASSEVTITPPPSITSTGLVATKTGATQVSLTWPASAEVTKYVIERRSGPLWETVGETQLTSWVDNGVVAQRSYAYRIYADRQGRRSDYSNSDIATTRSFTEAVSGQKVSMAPLNDLLAAVNSVRAAVGWTAVTWSNILASTDPLPEPSRLMVASQVSSARYRMDEALTSLGVPIQAYTTPILKGAPIRASDVNEVQQRTQ